MKMVSSIRDLELIKLRLLKNLNSKSICYEDIMSAIDNAIHLFKDNSTLKNKLFEIEQSVSEEDRILNIIDAKLDLAMRSNNKKDFLEINKSINNDVWTIIIQKKFGSTPEQLLKRSEIRRIKAAQKIVNLHKEYAKLYAVIKRLSNENFVLNALKMNSPEDILGTRKEIEKVSEIVSQRIKRFNMSLSQKEMPKLHQSWRDYVRESWDRFFIVDETLRKTKIELEDLKNKLHKKKSPLALIYENRKRKKGKLINKTTHR